MVKRVDSVQDGSRLHMLGKTAYLLPALAFFVLPQFRKLPEGFRKAVRKLTWELSFYEGPGRFPEGFRKVDRKENNHLIFQKSNCRVKLNLAEN